MIEVIRESGEVTWTVSQNGKNHAGYATLDNAFGDGVRELLLRMGDDGDVVRVMDHNGLSDRIAHKTSTNDTITFNENHVGKSW